MVPGAPRGRLGRPRGGVSSALGDLVLLSQLHRNQARIYRWMQEELMRRLTVAAEATPGTPASISVLTDGDRDALVEINRFLATAGNSMVAALQAKAKLNRSLPTEELESQLRSEVQRAASTFTDEEWKQMTEARAKARTA